MNPNWYAHCDLLARTILDLTQLPEVWNNVTGFDTMNDESLADLAWSQNAGHGFLTIEAAIEHGVTKANIDAMIALNKPAIDEWVRSMRDPLLTATDAVTVGDRWSSLDEVAQRKVSDYRQSLRDITLQDGLNVLWPAIPLELGFIRSTSIDSVARPSVGFLDSLSGPPPTYTMEQRQGDQWLRIRALRELRKAGGVAIIVDGASYWFWTDEVTRSQYALLAGSVLRNNLPNNYVLDEWKTMSGDFVSFSVATLHEVIDAGIANEKVVFNIAENHRLAMLACEEPESYDFTVGWPTSYYDHLAETTA